MKSYVCASTAASVIKVNNSVPHKECIHPITHHNRLCVDQSPQPLLQSRLLIHNLLFRFHSWRGLNLCVFLDDGSQTRGVGTFYAVDDFAVFDDDERRDGGDFEFFGNVWVVFCFKLLCSVQ